MFSQFFGNYLLNKQKITNKQFISCMEYMRAIFLLHEIH